MVSGGSENLGEGPLSCRYFRVTALSCSISIPTLPDGFSSCPSLSQQRGTLSPLTITRHEHSQHAGPAPQARESLEPKSE